MRDICLLISIGISQGERKWGETQKKTPKKENKQQKEDKQKKINSNLVDVVGNLTAKIGVQLVKLDQLKRYIEFDRRTQKLSGKGKKYLQKLKKNIKQNGLQSPLQLAVSKKTGRAYIFEGNHRMICLEELKCELDWFPVG